jgi:N-acetylglutamate synthase-like GNAT family acetyltransferase
VDRQLDPRLVRKRADDGSRRDGTGAVTVAKELVGTRLRPDEIDGFRTTLEAAGLPADDVAAPEVSAFRFADGARFVGYGALELHGADVLLRSIVVAPDARREGIGRRIVDRLLAEARELGASRACLLTKVARGYFEGLGFVAIDRASAPQAILATRQAARLCPASAALMAQATSPKRREP